MEFLDNNLKHDHSKNFDTDSEESEDEDLQSALKSNHKSSEKL